MNLKTILMLILKIIRAIFGIALFFYGLLLFCLYLYSFIISSGWNYGGYWLQWLTLLLPIISGLLIFLSTFKILTASDKILKSMLYLGLILFIFWIVAIKENVLI